MKFFCVTVFMTASDKLSWAKIAFELTFVPMNTDHVGGKRARSLQLFVANFALFKSYFRDLILSVLSNRINALKNSNALRVWQAKTHEWS